MQILNCLDHSNIVKYHETYEDKAHIYLIMEYIHGEELLTKINKSENNTITEVIVRNYMKQLLGALAHIHSSNIAHRDIKPENIMLSDQGEIKLVDFGLSKITKGKGKFLKTMCGTPYYIAPEIINGDKYDT